MHRWRCLRQSFASVEDLVLSSGFDSRVRAIKGKLSSWLYQLIVNVEMCHLSAKQLTESWDDSVHSKKPFQATTNLRTHNFDNGSYGILKESWVGLRIPVR